jgi:hypothetical protein
MSILKAAASVSIELPPDQVYGFIAEPMNRPQWETNLVEVTPESGGYKEVRMWMGRRVEEILKVADSQPGSKLVEKSAAGEGSPVEYSRTQTFESTGGGTKFTLDIEMDDQGMFGDSATAVERMIQKSIETDVNHLKEVLEASDSLKSVAESLPSWK